MLLGSRWGTWSDVETDGGSDEGISTCCFSFPLFVLGLEGLLPTKKSLISQ
jgi:hypothetical protein